MKTPVVLVAHSNAGRLVPVVVQASPRPVVASVFVDAALPERRGPTPGATAQRLAVLRGMAGDDGRLPPWTHWFDEAQVAPLFPNAGG